MSTPVVYSHDYDAEARELEVDFYFAGQDGGHVIRTYSNFSPNEYEKWRLESFGPMHFFMFIMDRKHTEERVED